MVVKVGSTVRRVPMPESPRNPNNPRIIERHKRSQRTRTTETSNRSQRTIKTTKTIKTTVDHNIVDRSRRKPTGVSEGVPENHRTTVLPRLDGALNSDGKLLLPLAG